MQSCVGVCSLVFVVSFVAFSPKSLISIAVWCFNGCVLVVVSSLSGPVSWPARLIDPANERQQCAQHAYVIRMEWVNVGRL